MRYGVSSTAFFLFLFFFLSFFFQSRLTRPTPLLPVCLRAEYPLYERVHAIRISRAMLSDGTVHESQVLEQH